MSINFDLYLPKGWNFKVQWCLDRNKSPADDYWWKRAEEAWQEHLNELKSGA